MTANVIIEDQRNGKDDNVNVVVRRAEVSGMRGGGGATTMCIIDTGPARLASLSTIMEPYSLDGMTSTHVNNANRGLGRGGVYGGSCGGGRDDDGHGMGHPMGSKVCVIDPNKDRLGIVAGFFFTR
jgi:hypothetical protein